MALKEEWEAQGNWLFRWRSYLPFVLLLLVVQACLDFDYPQHMHALQEAWMLVCLGVSFAGMAIRVHVVGHTPGGTSGRNTRQQIAECLNSRGLYSVVRHPLYLGNFLIWLGIALFFHHIWLTIAFCAVFWLYYERIMFAEEEFLRRKFGDAFVQWAMTTPAFVPRLRQWRTTQAPMDWRKVVRREYTTAFGILFSFGALELAEHLIVERQLHVEPHWRLILPAGAIGYAVLRWVKHRTTYLVSRRQPSV